MVRSLAILIIGAIIISCLITPPIFSSLLIYSPNFRYPYARVYDRVLLLVFIVLAIFLRKQLSLKELRPFFFTRSSLLNFKILLIGMFLALIGSAIGLALLINFGELAWTPPSSSSELVLKSIKSLITGLIVGFLEESIFRLLLFVGLIKRFNLLGAALISSAIYAVAHFVSPDKSFIYSGYSISIGFEYMHAVISRLFLPGVIWGIIGLFLVGLTLCYVVYKTGSVYLAVGLHCGWIMSVKLTGTLTSVLRPELILPGTGTRFLLVAQPIGWLSVLLVFCMINSLLESKRYNKIMRDQ